MSDKQLLLDELLALMAAHGTDAARLEKMREPEWLERVSLENLQFLLAKHRALAAIKVENEGVYERWQRSKRERAEE